MNIHPLWEDIMLLLELIEQSASEKDWDDLIKRSITLEDKLKFFFESEIIHLDQDAQIKVRLEGEDLLRRISSIHNEARVCRSSLVDKTAEFVNSKKGINAYKKI